ncbi:MAG: MarR family transcriptional regulator [Solirubrobacterales bacterium]|nr:MarR family transcriptional regulator [Solirubrobacterales bacterium]
MSRRKRQLWERLLNEVRASQNATDRFDQAVSDAMGMNRTDMRLVDHLEREGRLTAGELAQRTGLTTGAITTAIDRLERAGFAHRVRDLDDRRRVYVELDHAALSAAGDFYSEHAEMGEALYHRYTEEQVQLLLEFVSRGRELNERRAAELEAELAGRARRDAAR